MSEPIHHYSDVVIVGAGGAGLMAAIHTSKHDFSVAVLSKVPPTQSHTVAAKGGINAALGNLAEDDWRWHMYDTVRGSDWLGDQNAIAFMCEQAPKIIAELEQMGVPFSRNEDGTLYQRTYGGQTSNFGKDKPPPRACAVADRTGHAIVHTLYQQALAQKTEFYVPYIMLDLIMDDQENCHGCLAWNIEEGTLHIFHAQVVILATGGFAQIYKTNTSSNICTGDGNAAVLRAGLPLQDLECVQFHPTSLYGTGILISEAARAEGGYLINGKGERFMECYAPKFGDLASRDVITRAMAKELHEGYGCGEKKDHLQLCLQDLSEETLTTQLPQVLETAQTFANIDPRKDPIPVLPCAHYTMGGIPTTMHGEVLKNKKQTVPGLMAIGEAACVSVHGANRLGCNSLLDIIVFGKAAADHIAENYVPQTAAPVADDQLCEPLIHRFNQLRNSRGSRSPAMIKQELQTLMDQYGGMSRSAQSLDKGLSELDQLIAGALDMHVDSCDLWNDSLVEAIETYNLLIQARATLASMHYRTESRGAHFREDYPERNDKQWLKHTLVAMKDGLELSLSSRPVDLGPDENSAYFPPEKREY